MGASRKFTPLDLPACLISRTQNTEDLVNDSLQRFDTGEVELAYLEWPGESPPILFLHGLSAGLAAWSPRVEGIRGAQRVFAYDARGHGDSGRALSYRITDFGRDAVQFIESVCREPVILVGHSLGAMTSLCTAAERPDLVLGILLIDPPLYDHQSGLRDRREAFEQRLAFAGKPAEELIAMGVPDVQVRGLTKLDRAAVAALMDGAEFEGWDTDSILGRIECPVLLEHGERGFASGLGASHLYEGEVERARHLLKDCDVVEIKGSGHIPTVQKPEEFTRVASGFVQRMVRSSRPA